MKMMKWALLGGAAFAVTATSAQADELTALKAQLEALQARVTQLEAQPATSMPSGYSLLGFQSGSLVSEMPEPASDRIDPNSGVTISVLPSADVAPAAEISVKGEIRTFLTYGSAETGFSSHSHPDTEDDSGHLDVRVRGRLVIDGKTETAVGEVGAHIRLQGGEAWDGGNSDLAHFNQAYGWWKFAPNWQLIAGYWDTTAAVQAGIDWDFFAGATPGPSDKNVEQMRLVYSTGPFTAAIALEDTDQSFTATSKLTTTADGAHHHVATAFSAPDRGQFPDIAGYLMYDSGSLMLQVVGVYQDDQFGNSNDWGIGGGGHLKIGDMATLTGAAVYAKGYNGWADNLAIGEDDIYWAFSAGVLFNIAENAHIEAGGGYEEVDAANHDLTVNQDVWTITGGIYWDPVSQVTVGVQANWQQFGKQADADLDLRGSDQPHEAFQARFGTWLRFP